MASFAIDLTLDSPQSSQLGKRPSSESSELTALDGQEEEVLTCFSKEATQRLCTNSATGGNLHVLRQPNDDDQRNINWIIIEGDDDSSCDTAVDEEWKKHVADGIAWTDPATHAGSPLG